MIHHRSSVIKLLLKRLRALFGLGLYTETLAGAGRKKSIFIRHLDGGSTNAIELELAALTNPIYDLAQYGLHFVVSPRHADVLLITGPLTWNMLGPARAAFAAMPEPKRIITAGDCADFAGLAGGDDCLFSASYAVAGLPDEMKQAIVAHIPGDPPSPEAIIRVLVGLETLPAGTKRGDEGIPLSPSL